MTPRTIVRQLAAALVLAAISTPLHGCDEHTSVRGAVPEVFTRGPRDAGSDRPLEERTAEIEELLTGAAGRALATRAPFDVREFPMAPLYDGLIDVSLVTGDPRYLAAVIRAGRRSQFTTDSRADPAVGDAVGRPWLRIHAMMEPKQAGLLAPMKQRFDPLAAHPVQPVDHPPRVQALYTSLPTLTLLARVSGDDRYLELADQEFGVVFGALFDEAENLVYCEAADRNEFTARGYKPFWSHCNAWAFTGLALMLDALPPDHGPGLFYVGLFQRMAAGVHAAQQADGFWYPNLHDPEHVLVPDISSGALFVLATAWGVRRGVLEHERYWPVVERGFRAIARTVDRDGAIDIAELPDGPPMPLDFRTREVIGSGAVLGAGAEILRALDAAARVDRTALAQRAQELAPSAPDLSAQCSDPCGSPADPTGAVQPGG